MNKYSTDYMTLEEIADYLNYNELSEWNLSDHAHYNRFKKFIIMLCREYWFRGVFYYDGIAKICIYRLGLDRQYIFKGSTTRNVKGHFSIYNEDLIDILNSNNYIQLSKQHSIPYSVIGLKDLPTANVSDISNYTDKFIRIYLGNKKDSPLLSIKDLKFLKSDVKVFTEHIKTNRKITDVSDVNTQSDDTNMKLKEAQIKIDELESQLSKIKIENEQIRRHNEETTDLKEVSNLEIQNIKKVAIKQFNRSLASVLIELDYKDKLRKGDIANYIVPHMKELAFVLADGQQDKANNLTVAYDTLYDNHLKNLGFKQGRQSDDEKQKVNIDLLFKKQLPITE